MDCLGHALALQIRLLESQQSPCRHSIYQTYNKDIHYFELFPIFYEESEASRCWDKPPTFREKVGQFQKTFYFGITA